MTDPANHFLDKLFKLAQQPVCPIVIVTGKPGSGKSSLSKDICNTETFGAVHVPADLWLKESTMTRYIKMEHAKAIGNRAMIRQYTMLENNYDWAKMFQDLKKLRHSGSVLLEGVYEQKTGELIDTVLLQVSLTPPHLIVLEGCCLAHDPIARLAQDVAWLDVSDMVAEGRRSHRDLTKKTPKQIEITNAQTRQWGLIYFSVHGGNARRLGERDEDALHKTLLSQSFQKRDPKTHGMN